MRYKKKLNDWVRDNQSRLNWTQVDIANHLQINQSSVSRILKKDAGPPDWSTDQIDSLSQKFSCDPPMPQQASELRVETQLIREGEIPVIGRLGDSWWKHEAPDGGFGQMPGYLNGEFPIQNQIGFVSDISSESEHIRPGDTVIGYLLGRDRELDHNDLVVMKRRDSDFFSFTLAKFKKLNGEPQFIPVADGSSKTESLGEPFAVVIYTGQPRK